MAGRGAAGALPPTPNGLLPTRGPGRGTPGRDAPDGVLPDAGGNVGIGAGVTGDAGGASTIGLGAAATTGSGCGAGAGSGGAAAVLAGGVGVSAGAGAGGKASRSRRATGASTVDEALFTNSPSSLSLARTSLLETLSSFASSCTRALPATGLLRAKPAASRAVALVGGRAHRWRFIECPLPFTAPYGCPDGGVRPMRYYCPSRWTRTRARPSDRAVPRREVPGRTIVSVPRVPYNPDRDATRHLDRAHDAEDPARPVLGRHRHRSIRRQYPSCSRPRLREATRWPPPADGNRYTFAPDPATPNPVQAQHQMPSSAGRPSSLYSSASAARGSASDVSIRLAEGAALVASASL